MVLATAPAASSASTWQRVLDSAAHLSDALHDAHDALAGHLPPWAQSLLLNPVNLLLLLLLLRTTLPLLVPALLFDPRRSSFFLQHEPTLAHARTAGIPGTTVVPATRRRWRNYLRRLRAADADADADTDGDGDSVLTPAQQQARAELAVHAARGSSKLRLRLLRGAVAVVPAGYSFLPAYPAPSIRWTVFTPRTLALHDGSALALSEQDARAIYDERRDGPSAAAAADERRRKAAAANARANSRKQGTDANGSAAATTEGDVDDDELEADVGGYLDGEAEADESPSSASSRAAAAAAAAAAADPSKRILLAIEGDVYDVTRGKHFYGPGGPYAIFAGRDASIGMAKQSFEADMLTPLDQPLASLEGLTPMELSNMREWKGHFASKYGIVGRLVNEGDPLLDADSRVR